MPSEPSLQALPISDRVIGRPGCSLEAVATGRIRVLQGPCSRGLPPGAGSSPEIHGLFNAQFYTIARGNAIETEAPRVRSDFIILTFRPQLSRAPQAPGRESSAGTPHFRRSFFGEIRADFSAEGERWSSAACRTAGKKHSPKAKRGMSEEARTR